MIKGRVLSRNVSLPCGMTRQNQVEHNFLDQYSDLDSVIHKLDPRTKLITILCFVLAVVITPATQWRAFPCYFVFIGILLLLSKLPLLYVLKRALAVLPFVLLIGIFNLFKSGEALASIHIGHWEIAVTHEGLLVFRTVLIKASLSIMGLILLSSTTKFPALLRGLQQLRMPRVMIVTLSFAYRYIFVLVDEAMRMRRARDSRNFGGKRLWQMKTVGNMVGTLFLRSYERGERVYTAMVSRGYDGEIREARALSFSYRDAYFSIAAALVLVSVSTMSLL